MSEAINIAVLVVNSIAALFAVIAAVIAVRGNHQSQEQFKHNMQVQERAINLSLFDARIEILEKIKECDFSFSRERVYFLFEEDISKLIRQYDECIQQRHFYNIIRDEFIKHIDDGPCMDDWTGGDKICTYRAYLGKYAALVPGANCTQSLYEQMQNNIDQHPLRFKVNRLGLEEREYSLIELDRKIEELSREEKRIRENLPNKIREYIERSISCETGGRYT